MIEFLLYYIIAYTIGYFLVVKLCKNNILFNYINCKTSRRVISVFLIFGIYILISILLDVFNFNKNVSHIFLGLTLGVMVAILSKTKYYEKS